MGRWIAAARADSAGIEALWLAAAIELDRQQPAAPRIPDALRSEYDLALRAASTICEKLRGVSTRAHDPRLIETAAAVFGREFALARTLLDEEA
ncbi:MAG: hypothetical protein ACREOJ_19445 [Gemmatimonadaceae bacterium]